MHSERLIELRERLLPVDEGGDGAGYVDGWREEERIEYGGAVGDATRDREGAQLWEFEAGFSQWRWQRG